MCWAKSLDDILATFFALACLHQLLAPPDNVRSRWRALLWCALACYAKESAVPLAVLPFFIARGAHKLGWRAAVQWTIPFVLVCAAYAMHRGFIIERQSQVAPISGSYAQTLVDMVPVVTSYVRLLCGVPPFLADYKFMRGGLALTSPEFLLGALLLAALVGAGVFAWRGGRFRLAGFGLLWTSLFLLPVANVLPMMQYMAERFLYLPLVGWLVAIAGVLVVVRPRKILALAATLVLLLWGATAWARSWVWQDELTLFVRTYQDEPRGERMAHNAVAAILQLPHVRPFFAFDELTDQPIVRGEASMEEREKIIATFTEAANLFPNNALIHELLGIALAQAGRPEEAIVPFAHAARLQPMSGDYHLNLARALLMTGQLTQVREPLAAAQKIGADKVPVLAVACEFFWKTGDFVAARTVAVRLNQLAPTPEHSNLLFQVEAQLAKPRS